MMSACLNSILRHTKIPVQVIVAAQEGNLDEGLFDAVECFRGKDMSVQVVEVPHKYIQEGREHGCILDRVVPDDVSTEYVMTLDSDCFPIADGWLESLVEMLDSDMVVSAGILHPWAPPPKMRESRLEWRVRSQHCWETTHVACQLMRTKEAVCWIRDGIGYSKGDDTGLGMMKVMRASNRKCDGYKPTRCPNPAVAFDAEFNRYSCVVYGDAVIHVGGFTRVTVDGDDGVFRQAFQWAAEKVLEEGGAEFLLDDANSYRYTLDREEEVASEKMQRLFGLTSQRMTI